MPDDHMRASGFAHHESSYFTGERAFFLFGGAVLGRDLDVRTFQTIGHTLQCREDRRDYHLAMIRVGDQRFQSKSRRDRLAHGLIHFPVSSDDRFTHENHYGMRRQSEATTALWFGV